MNGQTMKKGLTQMGKQPLFPLCQIFRQHRVSPLFHFHDLVEQLPKHKDARLNAIRVAELLVANEEWLALLFRKKQLPIKQLETMASVSRKTIERNRKYIIAVAVILAGDYIYLKDYLNALPPVFRDGRFLGTPAPRQAVHQAIPVRPTVVLSYNDSKRSPSFRIFRAALWSRSCSAPQLGHTHSRMPSDFTSTCRCPQHEHN